MFRRIEHGDGGQGRSRDRMARPIVPPGQQAQGRVGKCSKGSGSVAGPMEIGLSIVLSLGVRWTISFVLLVRGQAFSPRPRPSNRAGPVPVTLVADPGRGPSSSTERTNF